MDNNKNVPKFEDTIPLFDETEEIPHLDRSVKRSTASDEKYVPFGTSVARGLQTGITLGSQPVLAGLGAAGLQAISPVSGVDIGSKSGAGLEALYSAYKEMKEAEAKKNLEAQKSHPYAYGGAQFIGGVPSAVAGGAALGTAGMVNPVSQAATIGGTTGLGTYLGEEQKPTVTDALATTALGAGMGTLPGLAGKKIGAVAQGVGSSLKRAGSLLASRAGGIEPFAEVASTGAYKPIAEGIRGIGTTALEEGTLPTFGGSSGAYNQTLKVIPQYEDKATKLIQQVGKNLEGRDPTELNSLVGDPKQKAQELLQTFEQKYANREDGQRIISKLKSDLQGSLEGEIPDSGPVGLIPEEIGEESKGFFSKLEDAGNDITKLNDLKKGIYRQLGDKAYNGPLSPELGAKQAYLKQLGGILKTQIETLADVSDTGLGDAIKETNSTLGNLYNLRDGSLAQARPEINKGLIASLKAAPERIATIAGAKGLTATGESLSSGSLQSLFSKALPAATTPELAGESVKAFNKTNRAIYSASDADLAKLSGSLAQNPTTQHYASALENAVKEGNVNSKNSIIFALMQNPKTRAMINPDFEEDAKETAQPKSSYKDKYKPF